MPFFLSLSVTGSVSQFASDIGCQDDNVSTGRVVCGMLAAHSFAEIVLGTHSVETARLPLTLLLHIVFCSLGVASPQQLGGIRLPRSVYDTTSKRPRCERPMSTKRISAVEWSGSEIAIDSGSANTVVAS